MKYIYLFLPDTKYDPHIIATQAVFQKIHKYSENKMYTELFYIYSLTEHKRHSEDQPYLDQEQTAKHKRRNVTDVTMQHKTSMLIQSSLLKTTGNNK